MRPHAGASFVPPTSRPFRALTREERDACRDLIRQGSAAAREERQLAGVMDELRSLPTKHAVGLRAEMASTAAAVAKTRAGVDTSLRRIFRSGVDI